MMRMTTFGTVAESVTVMLVPDCPGSGLLVVFRNPVTWYPPPVTVTVVGLIVAPAFGGVGNAT